MTGTDWAHGIAIALVVLGAVHLATRTSWYRRWHRKQWLRGVGEQLGYDPSSWKPVEVPASGDGRPGYSLLLPSRSNYLAAFGPDLTRADFKVMIGPTAFLSTVCFADHYRDVTPTDSAQLAIANLRAVGYELVGPMTPCRLAGEPAVRYRLAMPSGGELLEWKFTRDGWLFAVRFLSLEPDRDAEQRALQHLDTWAWAYA